MYLRAEIEPGQGLGVAPIVVFKKVGQVVIEQVLEKAVGDLLTSPEGNFTSHSNEVSLSRRNAPTLRDCSCVFALTARIPSQGFVPSNKQNFWFELSYKLNGNDLKYAKIEPLFVKTGKPQGLFNIAFEGSEYEPTSSAATASFAPIAKLRFSFSGSWKPHASSTPFSFRGFVIAWANGHSGVVVTRSENDTVSFDDRLSDRKRCPRVPHSQPLPPKAPVSRQFSLSPPILFRTREDRVSPEDVNRMYDWIASWPSTTREKIARGAIPVIIEGFASKPGGKSLYNFNLSARRAESVKRILKKILSNIKFDLRSHGNLSQNIPKLSDVVQWLRNPQKYNQAAVIRFEDVE